MVVVDVVKDDIVKLDVDAIVNAANSLLLGGGGVDGAIHRAAGPKLLEECRSLGGCGVGDAKVTKGYNLPAKYIIHTVGPKYELDDKCEEKLRRCYQRCLDLAYQRGLFSVAFPCISTGAYGYPPMEAAKVAIRAVQDWIKGMNDDRCMLVMFCCYSRYEYDIYTNLLGCI